MDESRPCLTVLGMTVFGLLVGCFFVFVKHTLGMTD